MIGLAGNLEKNLYGWRMGRIPDTYSEPCQTSKMKRFAKVNNG